MSNSPNLHLRLARKQSGLDQFDLARLLGHTSASSVSRLESGEQTPDLRTALMLEAIFNAPPSRLFRALYAGHAKLVRDRAEVLDDSLSVVTPTDDVQRLRLELDRMIERIDQLSA